MPDSPRDLILQTFRMARDSGKQDWRKMTIAVLKNRLLLLTHGEFSESSYGARTVREFVLQAADTVRLDESVFPPTVELAADLGSEGTADVAQAPRQRRIRADLWRALVDYRSGREYVWDQSTGRARPRMDGEPLPVLPTISQEDLDNWRASFVEQQKGTLGPEDIALLERWNAERSPTRLLPLAIQSKWNIEMVRQLDARLRAWFKDVGLPQPANIVITSGLIKERTSIDTHGLAALRALIIDCIRVMTVDELKEIRLPPSALLRARPYDRV